MTRSVSALVAAALLISVSAAIAADRSVTMSAITAEGIGDKIGTIAISEADGGLTMKVSVDKMSDGAHGFHVHEKGNCGPGEKDGKASAGLAAGSHFDPTGTKTHKGPGGDGHAGDLPRLEAASGKIEQTVTVSGVKFADIAGRSLMIHEGGDNYTDDPANGGGGGRIACGVIPKE